MPQEQQFAYDQLRKEILHNDQLALQTLGGTFTLISLIVGFSSTAVPGLWTKVPLFFLAETIALIGLFQNLDRNRSTSRLATYLRLFLEPHMPYMQWETRLHRFRILDPTLGYGMIRSYQMPFYWILVGGTWLLGSLFLLRAALSQPHTVMTFLVAALVFGIVTGGTVWFSYKGYTQWHVVFSDDAKHIRDIWQRIQQEESVHLTAEC